MLPNFKGGEGSRELQRTACVRCVLKLNSARVSPLCYFVMARNCMSQTDGVECFVTGGCCEP